MKITELKKKLKDTPRAIVKFASPACGPCNAMAPIINKMRYEKWDEKNNVEIIDFNVQANPQVSALLKIKTLPTFVFYENGVETRRLTGVNKPLAFYSLIK